MGGGDLPEILIFLIVPKKWGGGGYTQTSIFICKIFKKYGRGSPPHPDAMCLSISVIETLFDYKIAIICIIKEHKSYFKINALSAFV